MTYKFESKELLELAAQKIVDTNPMYKSAESLKIIGTWTLDPSNNLPELSIEVQNDND